MHVQVEQRVEQRQTFFVEPSRRFNPREYELVEVEEDGPIKEFILAHHYSGAYPAARRRWGLYRNGRLEGAFVFSHPSNDKALTNCFPGSAVESVELGRVVLLPGVGFNAPTWALSKVFPQLAQWRCPCGWSGGREALRKVEEEFLCPRCKEKGQGWKQRGLRGVLSFADPYPRDTTSGRWVLPGHVGTMYKAFSGVFASQAKPRWMLLLPNAQVLSPRAVSKVRALERGWEYVVRNLVSHGAAPLLLEANEVGTPKARARAQAWLEEWIPRLTRRRKHPGNYRYLWGLEADARKQVQALSHPYPSRESTNAMLARFGSRLQERAA